MNEHQSNFEAWRYGGTGFVYPGDGEPAKYPGVDNPEIMGADARYPRAGKRQACDEAPENMAAWSRTPAAGKLRMMVVQYIIFGEPCVDEIAYRMKVSRRRVFQVAKEVRGHCMPLLKLHRGQTL